MELVISIKDKTSRIRAFEKTESDDCLIINENGSWAEGNLFKCRTTGLTIQPTNIVVNKKNINKEAVQLEKSRDFIAYPSVSQNFSSSSLGPSKIMISWLVVSKIVPILNLFAVLPEFFE